jgi:hypothetical protein
MNLRHAERITASVAQRAGGASATIVVDVGEAMAEADELALVTDRQIRVVDVPMRNRLALPGQPVEPGDTLRARGLL